MCSSSPDRARLTSTGKNPTLRQPLVLSRSAQSWPKMPTFTNALTRARTRLFAIHNLMGARRDVTLDDPTHRSESPHSGSPIAPRAQRLGWKTVATRQEIRLQNRLPHHGQGRLDHPVGDGCDPNATLLAAGLRGSSARAPAPDGSSGHAARSATGRETPRPSARPVVVGAYPSTPARLVALVVPYPIPRDEQKRSIGNEIEHIIKLAIRIITGPTVQVRRDL
jgi:hypothetical protein